MEKIKEIKQNVAGAENIDNCFCVILDYYCERFICGLDAQLCIQPISILNIS